MLNTIVLQGRLTKDAELRYTKTEKPVASFTLAVDRGGRDAGADFVSCVAWERTAQFIDQYFKKGDMALVQGKLTSRDYEDRNGNKRVAWEVIVNNVNFCGKREESGGTYPASYPVNVTASNFSDLADADDGELPF